MAEILGYFKGEEETLENYKDKKIKILFTEKYSKMCHLAEAYIDCDVDQLKTYGKAKCKLFNTVFRKLALPQRFRYNIKMI